jgi:hypothetical protein
MTGTDLCVNKPHKSRSYLNHLVFVMKKQDFWDITSCRLTKYTDAFVAVYSCRTVRP